ncbi:MAG: lipase family protein [Nocardioidaceae bacterium]|nr:lipase family protein [Nocardioidaceae bacterium]MCL2611602.1 lipase family protein [Nocardioidaceae bacterium]
MAVFSMCVLVASVAQVPDPASAGTPTARATRTSFYAPPPGSVAGPHGTVIRARRISGPAAFPDSTTWLVLYRSRTSAGTPAVSSGTVTVPDGDAPEGGWPLISWAHGTTGVADACAPSRYGPGYGSEAYVSVYRATLAKWVAAGYAVAQTDYIGLGTPGPHAYADGVAEAHAVADIAAASRTVAPSIGRRWVAMGHSQGGQAAIFASALGQAWDPQMRLLGAAALAPGSNWVTDVGLLRSLPVTNPGVAFLPLLLRGVQAVSSFDPDTVLTDRAEALLDDVDKGCLAQLQEKTSWGGIRGNAVFRSGADLSQLNRVLKADDPGTTSPKVPIFMAQGLLDQTSLAPFTEVLALELRAKRVRLDYQRYPTADHRGVIAASYPAAQRWVAALFAS